MERDLKRQIHVGIKARSHQDARNARYSSGMARQSWRVFRRVPFLPSSALPRRLAKKLLSQFSTLLVSCSSSLITDPTTPESQPSSRSNEFGTQQARASQSYPLDPLDSLSGDDTPRVNMHAVHAPQSHGMATSPP